MKTAKVFWSVVSPVADIVGILGFFGYSVSNTTWTYVPRGLYIALTFFLLIMLRLVLGKINSVNTAIKEIKVNIDFEKVVSQKSIQNIGGALPKTDTLLYLYKKLKKRVLTWSEDAVIKRLNVYIDYNGAHWDKPVVQAIAYSKWKNEEGWFYEGNVNSESFEEGSSVFKNSEVVESDLFFLANERWQDQVAKAFRAVSGKITGKCSVRIYNDSILVDYMEGKVNKKVVFKTLKGFKGVDKS